eukprot:UN12808
MYTLRINVGPRCFKVVKYEVEAFQIHNDTNLHILT